MKKKREIDWDYIVKSIITWLALLALLLAMSIAVLSCSATFIKGHHNSSSSAEQVEADGDELELMGRHKKNDAKQGIITPKTNKDEKTKVIDSISIDQPIDTIAGE